MPHFNPSELIQSTFGGLLIASATSIFLYFNTRIAGCSGVLGDALKVFTTESNKPFRHVESLIVICGLVAVPLIVNILFGHSVELFGTEFILFDQAGDAQPNKILLLISGFVVGCGVIRGCGCTSGHGVVGIPLMRPRSVVAVATFMAAGMVSTTIFYGFGLGQHLNEAVEVVREGVAAVPPETYGYIQTVLVFLYPGLSGFAALLLEKDRSKAVQGTYESLKAGKDSRSIKYTKAFTALGTGLVFGTGLLVSGMCRPSKVIGFLNLQWDSWDPSLACVMGGAVVLNSLSLRLVMEENRAAKAMIEDMNDEIDANLICGATLFGLGWGLGGVCPGPGIITTFTSEVGFIWTTGLISAYYAMPYVPMIN